MPPTLCLAGLAHWVHLIAGVALTLEVSFEVDANLTAGIWILTLVNVCREKHAVESLSPIRLN